jgi:hypothetical protein
MASGKCAFLDLAASEGALGRQFQSLSIVFVRAVNTKLASL